MTFQELWAMIEGKNPNLKNEHITMAPASFKRALRLAYDKGAESKGESSSEIFDRLFGGGR